VRATSESGHREVLVAVRDNGPGIPPHRVPILFEPFRQIDGSSTRSVGGLGIGLSFCREIMTAMGGRITVESEPGKGSTFTLRLPTV
jgi:signal transduction histidine kinase